MDADLVPASNIAVIFERYLRKLAISEFPCGTGKWRNDLKWESDLLESKSDISAELFTVEKLLELSCEKPFHKEIVWSRDAKTILNEAIKYPQKTRLDNIHRKFKSLRMVNKDICDVDEYITKFEHLEELVLSVNNICSLNGKLLPRSLRVLELAGNELHTDIASLCISPPHLQHIGLSHNNISAISNFIQPRCWESLLSLDLSFNNLENLFYISELLKELPKLRNLHLIGNPLCLFIGYRGYVVDSFLTLAFLDEVSISAHERHLFKGMSKLKELLACEFCVVNVEMDDLKGSIRHDEVEQTEDLRVRYGIEFTFMEDCFVFSADDVNSDEVKDEGGLLSNEFDSSIEEKNATLEEKGSQSVVKSNDFSFIDEEKELIFDKYIVTNDIKQLLFFLSNVMEVRIIRNFITMSDEPPVEKEQGLLSRANETDSASADKMAKKSRAANTKDSDSLIKQNGPRLMKPRKFKVNAEDLYEVSRISQTCAKVDVDCRAIIDGLSVIKEDYTFTLLDVYESEPEPDVVINKSEQSDRVKKKTRKPSVKQQDANSSMKTTISGPKAGNKVEVKFEETIVEEEVEPSVCEPPSLHFSMEVIHWNTANEAFEWIEKTAQNFKIKS